MNRKSRKKVVKKPLFLSEFLKSFVVVTLVMVTLLVATYRISLKSPNAEYKQAYKDNVKYMMEKELRNYLSEYYRVGSIPEREMGIVTERLCRLSSEFGIDACIEINGKRFADSSRNAFLYKGGDVYRYVTYFGVGRLDLIEEKSVKENHVGSRMMICRYYEAATVDEEYSFSILPWDGETINPWNDIVKFETGSYTVFTSKDIFDRSYGIEERFAPIYVMGNNGEVDSENYTYKYSMKVESAMGEELTVVYYSNGLMPKQNPWEEDTDNSLLRTKMFNVLYEPYNGRDLKEMIAIYLVLDVALCVVVAAFEYFRKKSVFDVVEYRKKTTDAMAHDLKTPLATIAAFSENLEENINTEKREYYAKSIRDNVTYMNGIINSILELSRSSDYNAPLDVAEVNVRELLDEMLSNCAEAYSKKSFEIEGEASIKTDKKVLSQAIENLVTNAFKYAPEFSTVKVKIDKSTIVITNKCEQTYEDVEKLKEPFVKSDASRGFSDGSGLGLSIADENLSKLNMKLVLSCSGGEFKATIKL